MLSMSGRVTMRGRSRWCGKGGSYRTIQRFFTTSVNWCHLQWLLIRHHLIDQVVSQIAELGRVNHAVNTT